MTIKKIGIIGAGQMGSGIAHVCALSGYEVGLYDISTDLIEQGLATINGNMARQVKSDKITEADRKAALERIAPYASFEQFGDVDLVIESAVEDEDVKRKILSDLCPHLQPDAMIGSNTSSISITRLAAVTDRPERFMGIHFMNPVPVMELVELIRGIATADEIFQEVREFVGTSGQVRRGCRRFSGLHREPGPVAHDQRSRLHPV